MFNYLFISTLIFSSTMNVNILTDGYHQSAGKLKLQKPRKNNLSPVQEYIHLLIWKTLWLTPKWYGLYLIFEVAPIYSNGWFHFFFHWRNMWRSINCVYSRANNWSLLGDTGLLVALSFQFCVQTFSLSSGDTDDHANTCIHYWTANDHSLKVKDIIWQDLRSLSF